MAKIGGVYKVNLRMEGSIIMVDKQGKDVYLKQHFHLGAMKAPVLKTKEALVKNTTGTDTPTGEELYTPKSEDLIRVPFRGLSATVVAGGTWRATDFTDEAVLKRSMKKLIGKTAFTEHWQYALNNIGVIEAATWSGPSMQGSIRVPAGIDIVYLIDAKRNEELARSLLLEKPSIYSNSVTVEYAWEPTHDDFTDEDDFLRNIGKMGPDKRMIARKAVDILDYHESSILWMGADPFAKMKDKDGNLINIDEGAVFEQVNDYTKDQYQKEHFYMASFSFRKENINLTSEFQQNDNIMEKELIALLKVLLGIKEEEQKTAPEVIQMATDMKLIKGDEFTKMSASLTKVTELEKEVGELKAKGTDVTLKTENEKLVKEAGEWKTEKDGLEKKVLMLEPLSKIGESTLTKMRAEVDRLYLTTLKDGETADAALQEKFKKAEVSELNSFLNLFAKGAQEKFEAHCESCKSTKISLRSTFSTDPAGKRTESNARPRLAEIVQQ